MSAPPKRPAARSSLRLAALRVVVDHFDLRRVVGEREALRDFAADVDRAQASRDHVFELAEAMREAMDRGLSAAPSRARTRLSFRGRAATRSGSSAISRYGATTSTVSLRCNANMMSITMLLSVLEYLSLVSTSTTISR